MRKENKISPVRPPSEREAVVREASRYRDRLHVRRGKETRELTLEPRELNFRCGARVPWWWVKGVGGCYGGQCPHQPAQVENPVQLLLREVNPGIFLLFPLGLAGTA